MISASGKHQNLITQIRVRAPVCAKFIMLFTIGKSFLRCQDGIKMCSVTGLVEVYVVGGAVGRGFKFTVKMPRDVFPIIKF